MKTLVDCIREVIGEHPDACMYVVNRDEAFAERLPVTLDDLGEHEMFFIDGRPVYVNDEVPWGCVGACDHDSESVQ